MASEPLMCPFCGYKTDDAYFISLHVEQYHTEDSPFRIRDSPPLPPSQLLNPSTNHGVVEESQEGWVQCPQEDCGEEVLAEELNEHLDLHLAERLSSEDGASITRSNMDSNSSSSSQHSFAQSSSSTNRADDSRHHSFSQPPKATPSSVKAGLRRSIEKVGFNSRQRHASKSSSSDTSDARLGVNSQPQLPVPN